MRRLQIDLEELIMAFQNHNEGGDFYLDLETGAIELVTDDMRSELEFFDDEAEDVELGADEQAVSGEQELMEIVRAVEEGLGTRYIAIPSVDSRDAYRDMEDFIDTVGDPRLQGRLSQAISGRGAFRYFKDVLQDYPEERQRWFTYRDERMLQRVRDWLQEEQIEPIE